MTVATNEAEKIVILGMSCCRERHIAAIPEPDYDKLGENTVGAIRDAARAMWQMGKMPATETNEDARVRNDEAPARGPPDRDLRAGTPADPEDDRARRVLVGRDLVDVEHAEAAHEPAGGVARDDDHAVVGDDVLELLGEGAVHLEQLLVPVARLRCAVCRATTCS